MIKCNCKTKKCIKTIRGFKYLTLKQKKELINYVEPWIFEKYMKQQRGKIIIKINIIIILLIIFILLILKKYNLIF